MSAVRGRWLAPCLGSALLLGLYHRLELPFALLGFVALVPWLRALDGAASLGAALGRTAVLVGASVPLSFPWLVTGAGVYGSLPAWAGWPLLALLAPLLQPQAFVAATARHLFGGPRWPGRVAGLCAWLLTEALAPRLFDDALGYGLYPLAAWRPLAAFGGAGLLTVVVLGVNELLAALIARGDRRGWGGAAVGAGLAGLVGFVPVRMAPSEGPRVTLAAVQASLPRYDELLEASGSAGLMEAVLEAHEALTVEAAARGPDLIAWGETVYPTTFGHPKSEAGAETDARVVELARRAGRPLLFGGYDTDGREEFNAAFLLGPDGATRDVYRKSRLFPVGEYVPFGGLLVKLGLREGPTGWGVGPGPRALEVTLGEGRTLKVQPLICYEAVFAELGEVEADLFVVLTNDGGFRSELEARQNLVVSAFRSLEGGRPQLRVANSGTSAVIDASGEVVAALPFGAKGVLSGSVALGPGRRPLPTWWVAAVGLVGLMLRRVQRPGAGRAP